MPNKFNRAEGRMNEKDEKPAAMNFESILQQDVPKGRDGKHKHVVTQLLNDLERLAEGSALRIPVADLPDTKENIRSALNRATRQRGLDVATSSDAEFLYVWKLRQGD
jgi:hypothetical protein